AAAASWRRSPTPTATSSGCFRTERCFAMADRKPAKKGTQKSAKSSTAINKKSKGFTDEERAAMKERAQELKADARRGPRGKKDKADGEGDVLAKIAAMQEPDRAMAKRLHAIITASAPALSPKIGRASCRERVWSQQVDGSW